MRHRALLDRLDASLGDGDHGENMSVGFGDAVRAIGPDDPSRATPATSCGSLGQLLVASVGGAGGSLYGTAFMEAGIAVAGPRRARCGGARGGVRRGGGGPRPARALPAGRQDDL